jgi:hypothetical protein
MEIDRIIPEEITIEQFADRYNLVMEVRKYSSGNPFFAHFKNAEVRDGSILITPSGRGHTEEEAILNYAKLISEKILVFNSFSRVNNTEIRVPCLIE